jgi:hypothetical protein
MPGEFFMDQFARGYGVEIKWLTDSQRLRNAELEIDSDQRLASSKVIGLFGSTLRSNILFKQNNLIGVYFPTSKEHSLLSRNADFFEAGIKFSSIFSEPETPMSAEPQGLSPSTQMELVTDTDKINSYLNLPSNISLFPFPDQKREIPQTPMLPAESPSFFSPSFADHISTSTSSRHDPRVHTINIPFQLHSPIRSQSYPTTPSPARGNAHNSGSYSSMGRSKTHRSVRRSSNSPPPNTTAILGRDLETLLATGDFLIIDIRSFAVYAKSRIINAINVCIPTVLLKRKSLSVDDISESIVSKNDRGRFAKWKEADGIVIYDADSLRVQDSYPLTTLAGKFLEAGFKKTTYGLIGISIYMCN